MANVKNGSDLVTTRDYQGLPLDALHSDGHPTQDFPILGRPPPPTQPSTTADSWASLYHRISQLEDDKTQLQRQLTAERARKPRPPQQPTPVGTSAATAVNGGSLWWQRQDAASGSSPGLPVGVTRQSGSEQLQQRSAASPTQAPTIAGPDFVESALPLGYPRDFEESSRRWIVAEDAYRQQIQSQRIQIQDLCSESERLKKALTAARSMASLAAQQLQDPDSGFTTTQGHNQSSTSSSSSADRRWSSAEENYKHQIQELSNELACLRTECNSKAEQLQQYKDELEVLYMENNRLKKRLSAQPAPMEPQTYPDSGVASSQGVHISSSTVNSSRELSGEALQTIILKVQKSREAVDELKGVVQHQTKIIKNFKLLFEKRCKQQGEPSNDVAGADSHLGFEAALTRSQQREDNRQPPQSCRAAVVARSGSSPTGASFATVSPACFSYTLQQPGRTLPRVDSAPAAAAATKQPQPPAAGGGMMSALTTAGGRQAVEQSDQSRSLGPITAGCIIGDDGGWVRDGGSSGGVGSSRAPQASLYPSTPAEAYGTTVVRYGTAEQGTLGGLGSADGSIGGTSAPTMVSFSPSSMAAAAVAAAAEYSPAPTGTAPAREHRLCPVCNMRFSTSEPLERLQEHILDCEGTSASLLPAMQQQQPTPFLPGGTVGSEAAVEEVGHADERTCPMCNAHFPPELPQREYELHVMSHFEEDYIVAGREPLPSSSN